MTTRPNVLDDSDTSISEHLFATYPLHHFVWLNNLDGLINALFRHIDRYGNFLEVKDPHGRTPLQLAVRLYRPKLIQMLLSWCSAPCSDNYGFNIFHDALTIRSDTDDTDELLQRLYERVEEAEIERKRALVKGLIVNEWFIPMKDFYYEIHLDYSPGSLLPFNRMPRDTIRIWKRDNGIRIDSTLEGVDTTSGSEPVFMQGDRTWMYMISGEETLDFECYSMEPSTLRYGLDKLYNEAQEIDAAAGVEKALSQKIRLRRYDNLKRLTIAEKMQKTVLASFVCACLQRQPVQMTEQIGDYFCAVYSVTNYWEVVTKKWDHLVYSDRELVQLNTGRNLEAGLDEAEYFDPESREDIGPPPRTMKSNKFPCKAKLWMTQIDRSGQIGRQQLYFTIQQHVLPILGLLLQRFSFLEPLYHILDNERWINQPVVPIKAEIPLYSKVKGPTPKVTISFANLYGRDNPTGLGLTPVAYRDPSTGIETNGITIGTNVFDIIHNFRRID